uniref:Uncharacterized protein n=2 Tax=Kalmanozyma brasiliensis (strain GHG001) TaxID=1365824 RepID=V5GVJ6_KALBG
MSSRQSHSVDSTPLITSKRLSVRSHSDDSSASGYGSHSGEEKLTRTPPLSRSQTATPTTPASVLTHDKQLKLQVADADKSVLTPTAALESLRVLENSFVPSTLSLPLDGAADAQDDDKLSLNTALASPTKSTAGDKDAAPSSPVSAGPVSPTRAKRSSSYRKSVPTLDDLATRSKRPDMNGRERHRSASSVSAASQPPLSPSSTYTQTPSWISSLTTSEAIRVLAFQQDSIEAGSDAEADANVDPSATSDELSALRYALKYALARSDKLAEALSRANQDRIKAESELEILRNNVLAMLSSKSILRSPDKLKTRELHADNAKRPAVRTQTSEEEDTDQFEDAHSRHGHGAVERTNVSSPKKKQVSIDLEPRVVSAVPAATSLSRPPRAERAAAASKAVTPVLAPAAAEPAKPATGVSIASLRKKQAESSANASSSTAQRYAPSRKALDLESEPTDTLPTDEDEIDDEEFDMFPFHQMRRRAAPEVSMADFLNASRMSKSEIEQHDARRELEREDEAGFSHSRSPLVGGLSARRGILKNLGKLVETERTKRNARRTSASIISKPSLLSINSVAVSRDNGKLSRSASGAKSNRPGHLMSFSEESIIPSYPKGSLGASTTAAAAEARLRALSTHSSLRESLEKQSLWEAGIRA